MLIKLELENFQTHSNLTLDFTRGVNVIYGQTDAGKSCIRRALSWIYFNTPKGNVVRKTGTKKTSAKVTFDNGIQVERLKSSSVNAYILYVDGEEKRFDAVGKDIPEEVLKILKTAPITVDNEKINLNIANQIALPFLLDKPATFRSKLFNKLTGSDIVDKTLQSFNKDILQINRDNKLEKENIEKNEEQLKDLIKEKDKVENTCNKISKIFTGLKVKQEKYERLKNYLKELNNIRNEIKQTNNDLNDIKLINTRQIIELNNKINKLDIILDIMSRLKINKKELRIIKEKLISLKVPEIDIKKIEDKITKFNKFSEIVSKFKNIQEFKNKTILHIKELEVSITQGQIKYKEILKKSGKCPTCKNNITEKCLKDIKL